MRLSLVGVLACAVLACTGTAAAAGGRAAVLLAPAGACGPLDGRMSLSPVAARRVMLCLTNYARTRAGLRPLRANATLASAGDAKLAADVSCGVFSHDPCGRPFETVFARYLRGADGWRIGENLAWGNGDYGTPRAIMDAWLHSPHHRENILDPDFTEIGIGYLPDQAFLGYSGTALWSQQFGTRTAAPPTVRG